MHMKLQAEKEKYRRNEWKMNIEHKDHYCNSPSNTNLSGLHVEHMGSSGISGRKVVIFDVSHC